MQITHALVVRRALSQPDGAHTVRGNVLLIVIDHRVSADQAKMMIELALSERGLDPLSTPVRYVTDADDTTPHRGLPRARRPGST